MEEIIDYFSFFWINLRFEMSEYVLKSKKQSFFNHWWESNLSVEKEVLQACINQA